MATTADNEKFRKAVMSEWLLDDAIEWIESNMKPEDVFDEAALIAWARENDFVERGE